VHTVVRRWLFALNAVVVLAGLGLGIAGVRRGFFLAALVPLALAPFFVCALAGARHAHAVARRRCRQRLAERLLAAGGIACDSILIAQLVTARMPDGFPMLYGPVIAWIGPVWFSVHALVLPAMAWSDWRAPSAERSAVRLTRPSRSIAGSFFSVWGSPVWRSRSPLRRLAYRSRTTSASRSAR
jgi:hypothetical protein